LQTLGTSATLFEFQPVPIHVGNIDSMMRGMDHDICPYQSTLRSNFVGTDGWNDLNARYQKSLFPEMEENWNISAKSLDFTSSYQYIDNYYSAWFEQMTIPNKLSKEAKTEVDMILRDGLYQGFFGMDLAVRLATTRFFNFLHTTLQLKIGAILEEEGIPSFYEEIKFMYLSAHDSSLTAFLSGLLQKQDDQMFFASSLLIELYQSEDEPFGNNSDFWVTMKINDKTISIGTEEVCGKMCQFQTVKDFLISREYKGDIDTICQEGESSSSSSASVWLWLLFATALFVFLSIAGYFITRTVFMTKIKGEGHTMMIDEERDFDKAGLNTSHSNATPATSRVITDDGDSD
jgi:hypothetical protein